MKKRRTESLAFFDILISGHYLYDFFRIVTKRRMF